MINTLIKDIRKNCNFHNDTEVDLFRQLAKSIVNHCKGVFIDETHGGNVCNVKFDSIKGVREKCEISDLLIITRQKSNLARATFWQAKKESKSKWISGLSPTLSQQCSFDFIGQFNQWELLSFRPQIYPTVNFSPPSGLLSSFDSPSIGSFGVFFEKNGLLELNYSVAEMITSSTYKSKKPRLVINEKLDKYYAWQQEVIVKQDLKSFLTALVSFQVGAILNPTITEQGWLVSYVKSQLKNSKIPNHNININNFFPNIPDERPDNMPSGGVSILILQSNDLP